FGDEPAEESLRKAQDDLARISRITTMGEWAFSISARLFRTTEASSSRSPTMAQELHFVSLSPNTTRSCYVALTNARLQFPRKTVARFTFAESRETWRDLQTDEWIRTCKIITDVSNKCQERQFGDSPYGSVVTCLSQQSQNQNEDCRQYTLKHHSQS